MSLYSDTGSETSYSLVMLLCDCVTFVTNGEGVFRPVLKKSAVWQSSC